MVLLLHCNHFVLSIRITSVLDLEMTIKQSGRITYQDHDHESCQVGHVRSGRRMVFVR